MGRSFFGTALVLAALAVAACAAYWPGLGGGYLYDDYSHIVDNARIRVEGLSGQALAQASLSSIAGPLRRPLSMLSFGLNHLLTGLDPFFFKLTNLLMHLANGLLLYAVVRGLLGAGCTAAPAGDAQAWARRVALAATAAWVLHPLNLTTVLYVVQRMTSLASLFVLLGVLAYLQARRPGRPRAARLAWLYVGTGACGVLGALAKETALLLPLYLLVVEATLRARPADPVERRDLRVYFALTLALPAIALLAYVAVQPAALLGSYELRSFSLTERLLTQARVLWFYLSLLAWPAPSRLGFYHDDFALSTGLLAPPTTLLALAGLLGLAWLAWRTRRRAPLVTFGIAWFFAGHALESSVLGLELVHEHRNYLPIAGPLIALLGLLLASRRLGRAGGLAALAVVALLGIQTSARALQWQERVAHALIEVEHHPGSSLAHFELARLLYLVCTESGSQEACARARSHFERAAALDRTRHKPLFALITLAYAQGGAPEAGVLAELTRRLREHPLAADGVADFAALVECHRTAGCALDPNDMLALFGAALGRSTLPPLDRARLLTQLGTWYAYVLGDTRAAVEVLSDVSRAHPGWMQFRLNLVGVLVRAGRYEEARREIALARAMRSWDDAHFPAARRERMLAELEALLPGAASSPAP